MDLNFILCFCSEIPPSGRVGAEQSTDILRTYQKLSSELTQKLYAGPGELAYIDKRIS